MEDLPADIHIDDCVEMKVYIHRISDNIVMKLFEPDDSDDDGYFIYLYQYKALEMADLEYYQHLVNELMGGAGYGIEDIISRSWVYKCKT